MLRLLRFSFALFILIPLFSHAQNPELVGDFNAGNEDGINEFNFKGAVINDVLVLTANNGSNGEELAVVKDGILSLLKDINPGAEDADPSFFTVLNGKIFFSAVNSESGGAIWVTDGTEEGTQLFFDPNPASNESDKPRELILSKSGHIFFTHDGSLFRIDGTPEGSQKLASNVNFSVSFNQDSPNYGLYKEGVAYLINGNFNSQLYYAADTVQLLGETSAGGSSFDDRYGITEVQEGLIFTLEDDGLFLYDQNLDTILPFPSPVGSTFPEPSRVVAFNQQKQFGRFQGGFYTYTGVPDETELVLESAFSLFAGAAFAHVFVDDKMIFHAQEGTFEESKIAITDGTAAGTNFLTGIADGRPSNMLLYGQNIFLATGVFNSSQSDFYSLATTDFEATNISSISGNFSKNIKLIAGLKDRLYFAATLDNEIGYELYSLKVEEPVVSSIYDLEDNPYEVLLTDYNGMVISENLNEKVIIKLFDVSGRQGETISTFTNTTFDIKYHPNINFLVFQIGDKTFTKKYLKTK